MTKAVLFGVLLLACWTSIDGICPRKRIVSISSGTSFGKCVGYCRRSVNITWSPAGLIAIKEANYPQEKYPTVQKEIAFTDDDWRQLRRLIDVRGFYALEDRIGCPDCADGGAEWIQVDWRARSKRVTFENGKMIEGQEAFINELRRLRKEYVTDL